MSHDFTFATAHLTAHPSGALSWAAERTLIVSDLHFEKGSSSAARGGALLPPYDSRETLSDLARDITALNPSRVICLGDSFHDSQASDRLSAPDRTTLAGLMQEREWIWILGNHDPLPPQGLGGRVVEEVRLGTLTFRHMAAPTGPHTDQGEVSGHYHPKASVSVRNRRIGGRCFMYDSHRLIMPAFGSYTGGLDARDPALSRLFSPNHTVLLCKQGRVLSVTAKRLVGAPRA